MFWSLKIFFKFIRLAQKKLSSVKKKFKFWFSQFFSSKVRLMDSFLFEGNKVLFRACISLVHNFVKRSKTKNSAIGKSIKNVGLRNAFKEFCRKIPVRLRTVVCLLNDYENFVLYSGNFSVVAFFLFKLTIVQNIEWKSDSGFLGLPFYKCPCQKRTLLELIYIFYKIHIWNHCECVLFYILGLGLIALTMPVAFKRSNLTSYFGGFSFFLREL